MNYIELSYTLQLNNQDSRDLIVAYLSDIGFESFLEEDIVLKAYIKEKELDLNSLELVMQSELKDLVKDFSMVSIPPQNWNAEWEKNYFQPILIANRCLIRSSFHQNYPNAEYEIVIDPKMAFGTGHHATTMLMLEEILSINPYGKTVLDMGTGTGVLAILCAKMGASNVTAIDNDQWAYENTIENITINQVPNINVLHGDASLLGTEKYDLIFVNIVRNVIIADLHKYILSLQQNASLILSGFFETDLPDITHTAENLGLKYMYHYIKNNWVVVRFSLKITY